MTGGLDRLIRRGFLKVVAVSAALLALNAGLYVFGVARLGDLADAEKAQVEQNAKLLSELEQQLASSGARVRAYRDGRRVLDVLGTQYFRTRSARMAAVQRELTALLGSDGLTSERLGYGYVAYPEKQKRERWGREYLGVHVQFQAAGSYPQIKKFLGDLQHSEQFFVVDSVAFTTSNQGAVLINLSLNLSTYFLADGTPLPAAEPGKEAGTPKPEGPDLVPAAPGAVPTPKGGAA